MKIAIDGFNLGFKQGTGIATYGRELSKLLHQNGHEIYPVYGLNGISTSANLSFPQFVQKLTIQGEASKREVARWGAYFLKYSCRKLLGQTVQAEPIHYSEHVHCSDVADKLPAFTQLFNIPSVYRAAQAASFMLSQKPTYISFPKEYAKPDLLHLTCPIPISMKGVPKVVTYHDLIPLTLPNSTPINLRHYKRMMDLSFRDADLILSVSENSKSDLVNFLGIPEEKIAVTYQAVDIPNRFRELPDEEVARFVEKKFSLQFKKYFLFYGAIEPKKNVASILEAFNFTKTDMPIVVVGKDAWLYDNVARSFATAHETEAGRKQFRRIPYASFETLMYLLKGARGLIFPSLYEGFGLPILEAMQMSCPVITSKISSLPEVGGDAVHYVDPSNLRSIAEGIDLFASDEHYTHSLVVKGHEQALKFSPEQHYLRIQAAYDRVR